MMRSSANIPILSSSPLQPTRLQSVLRFAETVNRCVSVATPALQTTLDYVDNRRHRRSDEELAAAPINGRPEDYQRQENVPLSLAVSFAENTPGVYLLRLNGKVMKCGRASFDKGSSCGIAWRLRQYYGLSYDDRARAGDHWSVDLNNRDQITVSWQCCPPGCCNELEYKLFQKYGKGPWAKRAPAACSENRWKLLI